VNIFIINKIFKEEKIIIVFFIAVAIWQMVKIFDLAQASANNNQVANDKDNKINGYLMLGFFIFIHVITVICFWKYGDLPLMSNINGYHFYSANSNTIFITLVCL